MVKRMFAKHYCLVGSYFISLYSSVILEKCVINRAYNKTSMIISTLALLRGHSWKCLGDHMGY